MTTLGYGSGSTEVYNSYGLNDPDRKEGAIHCMNFLIFIPSKNKNCNFLRCVFMGKEHVVSNAYGMESTYR